MNLQFDLINMANIAGKNYKDRKILKRHKKFMPDRPSVRRPNNTGHIEFPARKHLTCDNYFKPRVLNNPIGKDGVRGWLM